MTVYCKFSGAALGRVIDITGDTITYLPPAPHTGFRTITKPWAMWW
jgi:hypothetical protein